jgi:hypothetical protein
MRAWTLGSRDEHPGYLVGVAVISRRTTARWKDRDRIDSPSADFVSGLRSEQQRMSKSPHTQRPAVVTREFAISPCAPFRLDLTARALRRRAHNAIDRWDAHTYSRALELNGTLRRSRSDR